MRTNGSYGADESSDSELWSISPKLFVSVYVPSIHLCFCPLWSMSSNPGFIFEKFIRHQINQGIQLCSIHSEELTHAPLFRTETASGKHPAPSERGHPEYYIEFRLHVLIIKFWAKFTKSHTLHQKPIQYTAPRISCSTLWLKMVKILWGYTEW